MGAEQSVAALRGVAALGKPQKTPSSGIGLGKEACFDLETARFLWGFKINRHKTTTKVYLLVSPFSALESLPAAQEGGGTMPWLLHKVALCVLLLSQKEAFGLDSRSHIALLEGRQQEGEPERKDTCPSRIWVAEGP